VQMLLDEVLGGGRTEYWDRAYDLTDLLRPNRAFPAGAGTVSRRSGNVHMGY